MGRGRRHKWLGWWLLFSLSPLSLDPFKGLDVAAAFSFLLVAGLSFSEKIQTWDKRNTREKDIISTGCFKTPKSTIFVVPKHLHVPPRTQPLNTSHGSQLSPRLTHSPSQLSEQNFTHQPTKWQHLPLNEPQNGGCPLGRSLIYEDTAQRAQTCY